MADQKASALTPFTPIATDILYGVDDPGVTPVSGVVTISALQTFMEANLGLNTSALTAGTLADARVAASNVTQHQAALSVATSQLTGTVGTSQIADDAVTFPKLLNATQECLIGAGAAGAFVEVTLGTGLAMAGGVLSASVAGSTGALAPVRVAAATNITIASPGATINGVTMASGDRTLHTAQTAGAENGPWVWNGAASAMTRPADFDADADAVPGLIVPVGPEGTADADTTWRLVTAGPITLGTTALTFALDGDAQAAAVTANPFTTLAEDDYIGVYDPDNGTLANRETAITYANLKVELTADLAFAPLASPNAQTGTTYTLVLGDANDEVTMSNASANVLTIPPNSSVAFPVGTATFVSQLGAGATSIEGDTGVTVNGVSAGTGTILTQYGGVSLLKIATDTWLMQGAHGGVA